MKAIKEKLTEAEFTRMVLKLARLRGWRTAHFRPAMRKDGSYRTAVQGDGVGFPDLLLVRGNVMLAAELKVGKNRTTPEQDEWLEAFDLVRGCYAMQWRPTDWPEIERVLEYGPGQDVL